MELVSICIPIYNPNEKYIFELIESLKVQTHSKIEVIISDNSNATYVQDLFGGDKRFHYIKNDRTYGIFPNLNNAISMAKGNYIQIVCQDDILELEMIEQQVKLLDSTSSIGFVYTQVKQIDADGKIVAESNTTGTAVIHRNELPNYLFVYGCMPGNLSTVMIKKSVVDHIGLFDINQKFASDFNYWIRIAEHYGMGINLTPYLKLRSHNQQASYTLPALFYVQDLVYNIKLLYPKFKYNRLKKFLYVNQLYNASNIRRILRDIYMRQATISDLKIVTQFPFSGIVGLFFLVFPFIKINIKKDVKFPA